MKKLKLQLIISLYRSNCNNINRNRFVKLIDISDSPKGVYILSLKNKKGVNHSKIIHN